MLEYILNFTGPANVRITSYGISETAIRAFVNMMDSGLIKKLYLLFDVSTKRNKLSLLLFASNVATKVFIGANHQSLSWLRLMLIPLPLTLPQILQSIAGVNQAV